MLLRDKVAIALEEKRDAFVEGALRAGEARERYLEALDSLADLSADRVEDRLGGVPWPGARPTDELTRRGLIVPFGERWANAREARTWALDALRGVPTVAVDGSQIAASKEYGVPVSLVQVAWFENHHDNATQYVKDIRNEVLTADDPPREVEEYVFAESRLNQRRFSMEMGIARERIERLAPKDANTPAIAFIDGTFVLSFTSRMVPAARQAYLDALFSLLDASERVRVPVIGYVDASLASDMASMLQHAFDLPPVSTFDGRLLAERMKPFDRTCAFQCARGDVMQFYRSEDRDRSRDLHFVYLKTGQDRLPARIDFPGWILEAGLLDHVLAIVRGEAVVGSGYPYALETADAAAVLTLEDRQAFYRLYQDFAASAGISAPMPGKMVSKANRR